MLLYKRCFQQTHQSSFFFNASVFFQYLLFIPFLFPYRRIWNTRMALHVVLIMYDDAMMGSFTSCSVVKMRAEEPQNVKSHVISESYC